MLNSQETTQIDYNIKYQGLESDFIPWIKKAEDRMFSLAAGNRIAKIATKIMAVGFGKILFAANELGSDIDQTKPFIIFAPDGTCSYNPIRTQRGFSYGAILDMEFDGLMATNNSMPNGCGFSIYELIDPIPDDHLCNYLTDTQMRLGQDQLTQLGKGNHFAGLYYVLDPLSGEDTGRRFVVIHCSGHVGGHRLYHPDSWLEDADGYHDIRTPHGSVVLLENEARNKYNEQYNVTYRSNAKNRDITMGEIFPDQEWRKLEEITHQGLSKNGEQHHIGTQVHDGLMPVAFNPEEGLIVVKNKPNLSMEFLKIWSQGKRIFNLGLSEKMSNLNFTPHGAGYEFKYPLEDVEIYLNTEGIEKFSVKLNHPKANMNFTYFREVREWMSYRRKSPIIQQMSKADLAEIIYEMPCLMQIYPLVSIPGGSH